MGSTERQFGEKQTSMAGNYGLVLAFGFLFGTLIGNVGLGLALGLAIATLWQAIHDKQQNKKGADVAVGISIAGLLVVIGIGLFF
jgi:hypothetical protein